MGQSSQESCKFYCKIERMQKSYAVATVSAHPRKGLAFVDRETDMNNQKCLSAMMRKAAAVSFWMKVLIHQLHFLDLFCLGVL